MPLTLTPFKVSIAGMTFPFTGVLRLAPSVASGIGVAPGCDCSGNGFYVAIQYDENNAAEVRLITGSTQTVVNAANINMAQLYTGDYWHAELVPGSNFDKITGCKFAPQIEMRFGVGSSVQSAYDAANTRGTTARLLTRMQQQINQAELDKIALEYLVASLRAQIQTLQGGSESASPAERNAALLATLESGGASGCMVPATSNTGTRIQPGFQESGCSSC